MPQIVCRHDITTRDGRWLQNYVHLRMAKLRDILQVTLPTLLFWILGPLCHLSVPSMICSNFYRPRNKNCYLYLPNVNYLTETVLSCSGLLRGSDSARGLLHLPKRPEHLSSDPLACYLLHGGAKIVMMRRRIKIPICCICVSQLKPNTLYKLSSPIFCCL